MDEQLWLACSACITYLTCISSITCITCITCIICIIWFTEKNLLTTWNQEMLAHLKITKWNENFYSNFTLYQKHTIICPYIKFPVQFQYDDCPVFVWENSWYSFASKIKSKTWRAQCSGHLVGNGGAQSRLSSWATAEAQKPKTF